MSEDTITRVSVPQPTFSVRAIGRVSRHVYLLTGLGGPEWLYCASELFERDQSPTPRRNTSKSCFMWAWQDHLCGTSIFPSIPNVTRSPGTTPAVILSAMPPRESTGPAVLTTCVLRGYPAPGGLHACVLGRFPPGWCQAKYCTRACRTHCLGHPSRGHPGYPSPATINACLTCRIHCPGGTKQDIPGGGEMSISLVEGTHYIITNSSGSNPGRLRCFTHVYRIACPRRR